MFERIAELLIDLYWWVWYKLPDKCERAGCCRGGVRGNENRINGIITCDYCTCELLP